MKPLVIVRRGELWLALVYPTMHKARPVLVISNSASNEGQGAFVIPTSSKYHDRPPDSITLDKRDGLDDLSFLVIERMAFLKYEYTMPNNKNKVRPFQKKIGEATAENISKVEWFLMQLFGLSGTTL